MRSVFVDDHGLSIGVAQAGAKLHDSPVAADHSGVCVPVRVLVPDIMRVVLDSGFDSSVTRDLWSEFGCGRKFSPNAICH